MTGERDSLVGKRVTVIGLGIEGVDAARYAASHGAQVVALDTKPEAALGPRLEELEGLPITYVLGRAQRIEDIAESDLVFVSQSVPLKLSFLVEAQSRGITLSSMTRYFLEHCPGPTIGITGSSGKTTTTALVTAMLAADGRPYRSGGNIGTGLLGLLDGIDERTWTVLEMSHTQLQLADRSPHIAAILNITPNHLDKFSWDEYVALKQNIVRFQTADDIAVLNFDDPLYARTVEMTPATRWIFTTQSQCPGDGAFLDIDDDADMAERTGRRLPQYIMLRHRQRDVRVVTTDEITLRGRHNVANVLAATAIAAAAGVRAEHIARAIREFRPVPHRLEEVAEIDGVRWVNDSIATTPERALAGIRSFEEPLVLLLGGRDKDLPKDELAQEALRRCVGIVFFGESAALFEAAVQANAGFAPEPPQMARGETLAEAVGVAREMAGAGDVVLLSPACASFDAYANFEERGEEFRRLVRAMAGEGR
jgi:UDP-N-acetylmuramoylalanine--D-glutamate ligase